ncbi:U1 small nuclear ribonucleoprotein C [Marchantia polymorpha subsp. ruderalis]|uniref:U1 small nuclear ribonucleoprotein C n=2 Tax=Marchantia polymorpha TaxID=3197 RepID=A0AAF6AJY3_MARPO|nr:hypothetical protein MARPO_0103s0046 [Marchantia polymorpha]BBM96753.1 hypothetical protein Mp_1g00410 [Marchantia polymorpha subsp. ruderalis]|eukprot:PTQ32075.1 hypothetical protein MARPO_0103s0046 [Marchantia polymorpha]
MPRYYCDYCDTYLTHDSPSVRKQHNAGYKHKANVRAYYQQFEEQQTQSLIDQKVKEHLGQTAAVYQQVQMGGAFHQHLTALGQFKPPIPLPVLPIPVPGSIPAASTHLPSVRLSALPVPAGVPQYRLPPPPPPPPRPPGLAGSNVIQANGLQMAPNLPPPPPPPTTPAGTSSSPGAPGVPGDAGGRPNPSMGPNGPSAAHSNASHQSGSVYRNQSYSAPPGTTSTSSFPQQQAGPPSSQPNQQRGLPQNSGSQSPYGYGPPPYAAPPPGPSASFRN